MIRTAKLTGSQLRYVNKAFWRNPTRAFFTFLFPLMFLVIFTSLLGNGTIRIGPADVKLSSYYVAAMAAFAVISASFNYIAFSLTYQRDAGILKRVSGTPLPAGSFLGAQMAHSLLIALLLTVITAAFGRVAYGATVPSGTLLLSVLVMVVVGAMAFCALGLAVTAATPNADAAAAVINVVALPVEFLSGIFIPFGNKTPTWITWVARIFPVRHFALGLQAGFTGTPFHWSDVLVVAIWGVGGLVLATRYFSWEPRT